MRKILWHTPDLQLFAGEGNAEIGETGESIAVAGQDSALEPDPDIEFDELVNGRFRDQFTKRTQAIIDKRFKATKELEAFKEKATPILDSLYEKYKISDGSIDSLNQAMADEGGKQKLESARNGLRKKIGSWVMQGKELQKAIPNFDLRAELRENPMLGNLLLSGVPLKMAYETVHRDEILNGAVAYTADKVRRQVVQGIEARGMRPVENGVSAESAVVTSVDVNSLTSQDILKILKQVENGASITF